MGRRNCNLWGLAILVLATSIGFQGSAAAQELLPRQTDWAWIYTAPLFDRWDATTGKAVVTVEGTKFTAKLFDATDSQAVAFTLTGTITGEEVRVRVVRENSDSSPAAYSGRLVTRRFSGFADYTGVQTILLFDQAQHQIGLTRTLRR